MLGPSPEKSHGAGLVAAGRATLEEPKHQCSGDDLEALSSMSFEHYCSLDKENRDMTFDCKDENNNLFWEVIINNVGKEQ